MANTQFPKATYRYDPYKNFRFLVKWDGKYVAGAACGLLVGRGPDVAVLVGRDVVGVHVLVDAVEAFSRERSLSAQYWFRQVCTYTHTRRRTADWCWTHPQAIHCRSCRRPRCASYRLCRRCCC
jgi:hypothetical protein